MATLYRDLFFCPWNRSFYGGWADFSRVCLARLLFGSLRLTGRSHKELHDEYFLWRDAGSRFMDAGPRGWSGNILCSDDGNAAGRVADFHRRDALCHHRQCGLVISLPALLAALFAPFVVTASGGIDRRLILCGLLVLLIVANLASALASSLA